MRNKSQNGFGFEKTMGKSVKVFKENENQFHELFEVCFAWYFFSSIIIIFSCFFECVIAIVYLAVKQWQATDGDCAKK